MDGFGHILLNWTYADEPHGIAESTTLYWGRKVIQYNIPIFDTNYKPLPLAVVRSYIDKFAEMTWLAPHLEFTVATMMIMSRLKELPYTRLDIADSFKDCNMDNTKMPPFMVKRLKCLESK